jgi:anaerobic selenocysteine-containing dehydrogenase
MDNDIRWVKTHCARMDHGGCALLVGVKGNRIVKVKGDPQGFLNRGYACPKGLRTAERLDHPARLKHPLRRSGKRGRGEWQTISWSEALQTISEKLDRIRERDGARAVAFCQGMPKGMEHFVLIRLANLFGSPNVVAVQDVCHAPREIGGLHTCGFYPVADLHHQSRLVVLWGSNITRTNEEGAIGKLLLDQLRDGTELIVIDPRRTALAEKASLWLQVRPGADHALALAFLNVIIEEERYDDAFVREWAHGFDGLAGHVKVFTPEKMSEVTGIPAQLIRQAARAYAQNRPAAIQWGNPLEQNIHTFDAVRAIICLMAVCGNLDIPGGNIQPNEPSLLGLGKYVRADLIPSKRKEMIHSHHQTIPGLMTVPPAFFRQAALEGRPYPVRGAYIQCANPLLSYADSRKTFEALMKLDFIAVSEIFMTPTACLADIVLPAATHLEFNDIGHYGLGHGHVLARPKVVEPPGECRPDMQILNDLGRTLTPAELWYADYEQLLEDVLKPSGLRYDAFAALGILKGEEKFKKYLGAGFRTATGRVELALSKAKELGLSPLPQCSGLPEEESEEYPLVLTSSKDPYYLHSSYRWIDSLRKRSPGPEVRLHPRTAAQYGIRTGDDVLVETRSGVITQRARLTDRVHRNVVHAAYGWWFPEGDAQSQYEWQRSNYNILTSVDTLGKEFGTPNLKGISCRIRRKAP